MIASPITTSVFQSKVQALLSNYQAALDNGSLPDYLPIPLIPALTPADTSLIPHDSISQLLATTASWIDLASPDPIISNISRQVLNLEIAYAAFCGVQNVVIQGPTLHESITCSSTLSQYARVIKEALSIGPYLQLHILLSMVPSKAKVTDMQSHLSHSARVSRDEDLSESTDPWSPWEAWNMIRTICNYSGRLSVGKKKNLFNKTKL